MATASARDPVPPLRGESAQQAELSPESLQAPAERGGQALSQAPARQRILDASLDAIRPLLGKGSAARAGLALGSEDKVTFVAAAGKGAEELKGTALDLGDLPPSIRVQ